MKSWKVAALAFVASSQLANAQTIPADAQSTCVVTTAAFDAFFVTGTPSLNGVVKPADSVNFPNTPNCSFYEWSVQMFLWLTSPAPAVYGGGSHIFDSSTFYDVSPPDQNGQRTFIPHFPGFIRNLALRQAQAGVSRLPVLFDKTGRLVEIAPSQTGPHGNPLIRNNAGDLVEVQRATIGTARKRGCEARAGKAIEHLVQPDDAQRRLLELNRTVIAQKFIINGKPIFIDPFGNVIETEEGQADDGVQMAQTGSLVYYVTMVNDVYAYFLTGVKDNQITPGNQFPTTQVDLNKITAFAGTHGKTFTDANA